MKTSKVRTFWVNDEFDFLERLLQSWIKQHLSYLHWYATALFDYSLPLKDLFFLFMLYIQT